MPWEWEILPKLFVFGGQGEPIAIWMEIKFWWEKV